jgi:hypothetical protein
VSTRIGIIAEGRIDHALLPPLLERIARDRAGYGWPVHAEDTAQLFPIRKRGHGGVLETLRKLVEVLEAEPLEIAFFVILLDRHTEAVQREIKRLLKNRDRFVLGVAIEEIEAWWPADRRNTLAWSDLTDTLPDDCRYGQSGYQAERDKEPKKTLDELTRTSHRFDRFYGEGNLDLALDFAEDFWREHARLDDIRRECPRGYAPFENDTRQPFRSVARRSGRFRP